MKYKVGIPRGMLFYNYYPLWNEFFKELGVEVVLSCKTNKEILDNGSLNCVDEACLPVKIFHGHVEYLKDKVDYIFIPKIMSIDHMEYCCPKYLGLPEMVLHSVDQLPEVIAPIVNLRKSESKLKKSFHSAGSYFTDSRLEVRSAYLKTMDFYKGYKRLITKGIIPIDALKMYNNAFKNLSPSIDKQGESTIMVLGHSYSVYDDFISMNVIKKLTDYGKDVITAEMIEDEIIAHYAKKLPKRMFWTHGKRIVGSAFYALENKNVDGIIYISAFGCGLDSVLVDLIERKANKTSTPFVLLTIDEQTGEAGINTRLEAFLDMMEWRKKDEDNFSTIR